MSPALRIALPADYATLATWITDAQACAYWAGPQLQFPFSANSLPHLLDKPGAASYSFIDEANPVQLIGFGQLVEKSPGIVHLARVIVAPQLRGSGFGRMLCELLLVMASTRNDLRKMTLAVYRDNPAAIALYSSLGFVEVSPAPRPEVIAMERCVNDG